MRLLVLLFSVLALVVPGRRAAEPPPPPSHSPAPPANPLSRRTLALPVASPGYRDGLRPVPEPARVRPYLVAAEHRRAQQVWEGLREELAEIAHTVSEEPAPRLPRRRPGQHAQPQPNLGRPAPVAPAAPAASAGRPSPETLQRILVRLRELDTEAAAQATAGVGTGGGY